MIMHYLKLGEDLWIGETRISLRRKSGQVASLVIDAPPNVKIRTPKSERREEDNGPHRLE